GGLNPTRMLRDYREQSARLALMHGYAAILTASDHMGAELIDHGLAPERVHVVRLPVASVNAPQCENPVLENSATANRRLRLLYVGRMTPLKGGPLMIDAAKLAAGSLAQALSLVFVGDGPDRGRWERKARQVQAVSTKVESEFRGWMDS